MAIFDTHMILVILGTAVVGAFVGLDRTAVGQVMVSQPIVVAPFVGWMLGDPIAGSIIGVTLELIWIFDMPIGTFVPADSTISAVSATAIAALSSPGGASLPVVGASMLLTTAMGLVTMRADGMIRHWNARLADALMTDPGRDAGMKLSRAHLSGLILFFMKSFLLYLLFLPFGLAAVMALPHLPQQVHRALSLFVMLLPLVGVALAVRKLSMRTVDVFLVSGFVLAAVMGQFLHASVLVVTLLTVTGGWLGARYYARQS